jgi:hypothetical protein
MASVACSAMEASRRESSEAASARQRYKHCRLSVTLWKRRSRFAECSSDGLQAEFEGLETRNAAFPAGLEICGGNIAGFFTGPAGTIEHLIKLAEPLL